MITWERAPGVTWQPYPATYLPAPGLVATHGDHGNDACCHGNGHHYGPLVDHRTPTPHRKAASSTDRSLASRSSQACRVIRVLLVMCFMINILVLIGIQLLPYVTSHVSDDVIHDSDTQQELSNVRRVRGLSAVLRQLREAPPETEEQLLTPDAHAPEVEQKGWGLSPFTNWTSGVRTEWEKVRNGFTTSGITFPLNEPHICGVDTFIVVMVTSRVTNVARRQTIRDTWGSVAKLNPTRATLIFLLGEGATENATLAKLLKTERETHRDLIQANIVDSYSNLAFKSIAMLKWMDTYCKSAKHLLKSDDDMYIHIDNLHRELTHSVHKRFIMGEIIAGAQPMQDKRSKWYTPRPIFTDRMYPKYVSGSAYVISGDFIHSLYRATQETQVFWLEDVYITGLCAKKAGATHVYNGKFGYKRRRLSPCLFRLIVTGHRLSIGETRRMWKALEDPELDCTHINIRTTVV